VSITGDFGDPITNGNSYRFNSSNSALKFIRNNYGGIETQVSGSPSATLDFASPSGTSFGVGSYLNAQQYPYQGSGFPGLNVYLSSYYYYPCYSVSGDFTVYQATFDALGNPKSLDIAFNQYCNGGSAGAHGEILLNAVPHSAATQALRAAQ
jgi:hypothetical protein